MAKWVTVEGIDGSGKTSALNYIKEKIEDSGYKVLVFKGIGSGEIGSKIREELLNNNVLNNSIALSFVTGLLDCHNEISKHLNDDNTVILTDRYIGTFYAYNVKANKNVGASLIFNKIINNSKIFYNKPDLEIFIMTNPVIASRRVNRRGRLNHIDKKPTSYFQVVSDGYHEYFEKSKVKHNLYINNNQTMKDFKNIINAYIEEIVTL